MKENILFRRLLPSPGPARRHCAPRSRGGVTLVELMVALTILTIGIVGLMSTFGLIQKGVQSAKNRTLASNLAQELMQVL
jgi:prepilin-type N-terminal cleavage/methylation domain-containing protein